MAKRLLDDLISIDTELSSIRHVRHEQCDRCGDEVELMSVIFTDSEFVCVECLRLAHAAGATEGFKLGDITAMNHDENRKRKFRKIREIHMGAFFDLNDSPPHPRKSTYAAVDGFAALVQQQSFPSVCFSGVVMTSNLTFNPRQR